MNIATELVCLALVAILAAHQMTAEAYARTASYEDQIVVRCPDKNREEVQILQAHKDTDLWHIGEDTVDLRMDRRLFARVQSHFLECHIVVSNVEALIQEEEAEIFPEATAEEQAWEQEAIAQTMSNCRSLKECEAALQNAKTDKILSPAYLTKYHSYEDMKEFYEVLAKAYPKLMKYERSIGKTAEKRDIPAVHITASSDPNRKKFYMQCQIHAREIISGAVCMYLAKHLVTRYGQDKKVTDLLDNLEFLIVPMANPDGIAYVYSHDPLWRKNRNHCKTPTSKDCGVDINRNFPLGFVHKKDSEINSQIYPGSHSISELETKAIIKFFRGNAPIVGSLDLHSYGQLILRPYGYTNALAPDEKDLARISKTMSSLIFFKKNGHYKPIKSNELYLAHGIATDWFYSNDASKTNKGTRSASICIELRDKLEGKTHKFFLPPDQIIPTAEEILPAVLYYADQVLNKPLVYNQQTAALEPPFNEEDYIPPRRG